MKKLLIAAIAVCSIGAINAQEVKFGAKGGLNFATLRGSDVENVDVITSFYVGGFAEIKIDDKFSFQPELLYSMQGAQVNVSEVFAGTTIKLENNIKLGYLNLPLMLKYNITKEFNIEAGPQVGFLLSSKVQTTGTVTTGGDTIARSETTDNKSNTSSVDFGVNIGAGYNFTEKFSAGLRYNLGLTTIDNVKDNAEKIYNGVFSLGVGYTF